MKTIITDLVSCRYKLNFNIISYISKINLNAILYINIINKIYY